MNVIVLLMEQKNMYVEFSSSDPSFIIKIKSTLTELPHNEVKKEKVWSAVIQ